MGWINLNLIKEIVELVIFTLNFFL